MFQFNLISSFVGCMVKMRKMVHGKKNSSPTNPVFYFLVTKVMKVLISCTENPKFFIEVLDELELFIDKKAIFDENLPSALCQQIF
jgi:hypothetical protein